MNGGRVTTGVHWARIVGLFAFWALVGCAAVMGGPIAVLLNIPSLILCLGGTLALALLTYGFAALRHALGALRVLVVNTQPVLLSTVDGTILRGCTGYAYACGALGTILGCVQMMATMDDPTCFGFYFAMCLLPLLYAVLLSEGLLRPAARRVDFLLNEYAESDAQRRS